MLNDHYPWLLSILGIQYAKALELPYLQIQKLKDKFIKEFEYELLGKGSYRIGFKVDNDWIIKFPINSSGMECNLIEAKLYEIYKKTGRYAKCYIKDYHGVPLIMMENIRDYFDMDHPPFDKKTFYTLPQWVHHEDGPQIGFNNDGKLRIFDYGNCINELERWVTKRKHLTLYTKQPII